MVPEINLLSPSERKQSQKFLLLIGVACLVLVILFFIFYLSSLKKEISALEGREVEVTAYRDALVLQASSEGYQVEGTLETAVQFVERISFPVTPLLKEGITLVGDSELVGFEFTNSGVILTTEMDNLATSSEVLVKLIKSDFFQDVKVEEMVLVEEEGSTPFYSVKYSLTLNQAALSAGGNPHE